MLLSLSFVMHHFSLGSNYLGIKTFFQDAALLEHVTSVVKEYLGITVGEWLCLFALFQSGCVCLLGLFALFQSPAFILKMLQRQLLLSTVCRMLLFCLMGFIEARLLLDPSKNCLLLYFGMGNCKGWTQKWCLLYSWPLSEALLHI